MKKLIAVLALALPLVGCAGIGKSRVLYQSSSLLGEPVGNLIVIEDPENGVLIYKLIEGTGKAKMTVLVRRDSEWSNPEDAK